MLVPVCVFSDFEVLKRQRSSQRLKAECQGVRCVFGSATNRTREKTVMLEERGRVEAFM